MPEKPFSWCFIGTGTLAEHVAKEITASGRHRIVSAFSRRFDRAEEFAKRFGGKAYETPEKAMAAADAVYVVTPHPSHYGHVKTAIGLGKPVLCEKPFTVRGEETRELFRLAEEKGVYIAEGMWTWFAPVAGKVKEWVDKGAAGEIRQVDTRYLVNVLNYAPRLTDPQLAGGALLDSGVYPVTYLYRLFGKPAEIRCSGVIENGVDLDDEIDMIYPDGRTHRIFLSIRDDRRDESLRIRGDAGEIFVNNFHFADRAELRDPEGRLREEFEGRTSMLNEFDLVAEEIRAGRKTSALVPPEATMEVMDLLDECRHQIGLVYPFEQEA